MKNIIYLLVTGSMLLGSCSKEIKLTPGLDDFDASVRSPTYKVGEEVEFLLEGDPDLITFYSGELYSQYEYRNGRVLTIDGADLSFTSARTSGARQPDQLRVLVSTDFNGDYNFGSLRAANWVDVTDRCTLPENITFLSSGNVDISDIMDPDKPLYIAYQYIARPQVEYGNWQVWNIQAFSLKGNTVAGPLEISDMGNSGFVVVEEKPDTAPSRTVMTYNSNNLLTRIALNAPVTTVDVSLLPVEVWAVSRAFDVGDIDKGADLPLAIKGNVDPQKTLHTHVYTETGTYKVHFIATNANVNVSEQVIREVEVTIVD